MEDFFYPGESPDDIQRNEKIGEQEFAQAANALINWQPTRETQNTIPEPISPDTTSVELTSEEQELLLALVTGKPEYIEGIKAAKRLRFYEYMVREGKISDGD